MNRGIRAAEEAARMVRVCKVVHYSQHAAKRCTVCKGK